MTDDPLDAYDRARADTRAAELAAGRAAKEARRLHAEYLAAAEKAKGLIAEHRVAVEREAEARRLLRKALDDSKPEVTVDWVSETQPARVVEG